MSQIKANNYQKAFEELKVLDPETAMTLKETIAFDDRFHFHVAMVRISDRPGEAKNEVSVNVQQFHEPGFEKVSKSFRFLGFNNLIVVHDPKNHVDDIPEPTAILPVSTIVLKTQADIESEIEEKAEARAEVLLQAKLASMKVVVDEIEVKKAFNLDELDFFQLKEFAEANEIDLSGLKKKEDVKEAISTWLAEQNKQ
jgi:hypothetical protein